MATCRDSYAKRPYAQPLLVSFAKSSHAARKIRHWINLHEREREPPAWASAFSKSESPPSQSPQEIPEADLEKLRGSRPFKVDICSPPLVSAILARLLFPGAWRKREAPDAARRSKPTIVKTVKRMLGMGEAPLIVKATNGCSSFSREVLQSIPVYDITGLHHTRSAARRSHQTCPRTPESDVAKRSAASPSTGRGEAATTFPLQLAIRAKDRAGLLAEITRSSACRLDIEPGKRP